MEVLDSLALGFGVAFSTQNLLYCFAGVALGTLIGVLPGIGPLTTIGLLFPITFYLPPLPSLIMLAGIYYGAQYGGAITSILVNLPGETASAVTCLDGYAMARQGRAGAALAISALASFLGRAFRFDPARTKIMVAAGAAAGISAAFNAPLAGAFFALESR